MSDAHDFSQIRTAASLKVAETLKAQLPGFLEPDEVVLTALPATWREPSDAAGPGTFQGALIGTDRSLHFFYNPDLHSQFNELTHVITNPRTKIVRAKKARTTVSIYGARFSVPGITHHLAITLTDGEVAEFYIASDRFDEILRYLNRKTIR